MRKVYPLLLKDFEELEAKQHIKKTATVSISRESFSCSTIVIIFC